MSNIAEMDLENASLLWVWGHRLSQRGYLVLSAKIFENVLELKTEEPQSYRYLALVLARQKKYQRIVLTWDADLADMGLWVFDPRGEKSFYGHKLSAIGI